MPAKPVHSSSQSALAILVGGHSRRMGQDKGLLCVRGQPLIVRHLRRLSPLFHEVWIICASPEQRQHYLDVLNPLQDTFSVPIHVVIDPQSSTRSISQGVRTALHVAQCQNVVILPVDAVGVDPKLLKRLCAQPHTPAAFARTPQRPFPFPSLWSKSLLSQLPARTFGITRWLVNHPHIHWIPATETEATLLSVNINTPEEVSAYFGQRVADPLGRPLTYLRLSLTEQCNMACQYCLPRTSPLWKTLQHTLSEKNAWVLLHAFRILGFEKVRFTGGEPSLHPHLLPILETARSLGYETLSVTTNGSHLPPLNDLISAGLTHLNISLDTLRPETFYAITGTHALPKVLKTIEDALQTDLHVKLNAVVLKGFNDTETSSLISWATQYPLTLRFIELMPTATNRPSFAQWHIPNTDLQHLALSLGFQPQVCTIEDTPAGPATLYTHPDRPGKLGFINPMSCKFCDRCNRLRVTAQGNLRLCLFSEHDIPLPLHQDAIALSEFIRVTIAAKPDAHHLESGAWNNVIQFRNIGG